MPDLYPLKFHPIYKEKIWGGRNLDRLFGRELPPNKKIGESWELADLDQGVSVVANGPAAGKTLTELTRELSGKLLGDIGLAEHYPDRFPLLVKFLDANDILSLQVHPDARAVEEIGPPATLKTECWYVVESRNGVIYKGTSPGTTAEQFRAAIETETVDKLVRKINVAAGDFHYLPAGTVHSLGAGIVVAEVQTPSDTTYRVTDWSRGREIHVERSMQCIRFELTEDLQPGAEGETLLVTDYFTIAKGHGSGAEHPRALPSGLCTVLMFLTGGGVGQSPQPAAEIHHAGSVEPVVSAGAGETVLLPAALKDTTISAPDDLNYLIITLPEPK